ncbi:MAG TPA: FmdB family zinc ribbon protein [Vicinamibacteria bacterium]|nr:FmdB family zinc ribbon protein [Vicinamibacteria bacterium]
MPIYEYECKKCGHRFESIQKVSDPPLNRCVKCKGKAERLVSSPAIQFKGSGWYVTDYARTNKASGDSKASEAEESTSKPKKDEKASKKDKPAKAAAK